MIGAKELSEARSEGDEGCMPTLIVFRSVNLARVLNCETHVRKIGVGRGKMKLKFFEIGES